MASVAVRIVGLLAVACVAGACNTSPYREVNADIEPVTSVDDGGRTASAARVLRISVAGMESPRGTYSEYAHLFEEISHRVGMDASFVQRRTYGEVNELLATGGLDAALICTGGYLELERRYPRAVDVVAVPIVHGADTYQALLLVPATSAATSLADLGGKRFAFTDQLSLSGHAWIVDQLREQRTTPDAFFGATLFTASHDRSITAVARGVVDGAAVHSIIYEHLLARDPTLATRTRVIQRSPPFGMTPVVVSRRVPEELRRRLAEVLWTLAEDPEGAAILQKVQFDRFAAPAPHLFDSAAKVVGR